MALLAQNHLTDEVSPKIPQKTVYIIRPFCVYVKGLLYFSAGIPINRCPFSYWKLDEIWLPGETHEEYTNKAD